MLTWVGAADRLGGRPGETGQALILMLLAITIIFAMGAIALDFGLWLTERQGAQKDADSATRAGAFELLRQHFADPADNDPSSVRAFAEDAVYDWAGLNGLDQADVAQMQVDDTNCLGPSQVIDSVSIAAEHDAPALFASIFGGVAPEIGAPAKACVGSISTAMGLLPLAIQIEGPGSGCWADLDGDGDTEPRLGEVCALRFGDEDSDHITGVRLYNNGSAGCSDRNGSSSGWQNQVENGGANSECHVYNYFPDLSRCNSDPGGCAYILPNVDSDTALGALHQLLSGEGECDGSFGDRDGTDELREIVQAIDGDPPSPPHAVLLRRDCTSPRLVTLLVTAQFPNGSGQPMPIEAFATFLIAGCELGDQFDARCANDEDGPEDDDNDEDDNNEDDEQFRLRGSFIDLYAPSGAVAQISKWSPKRIILVE